MDDRSHHPRGGGACLHPGFTMNPTKLTVARIFLACAIGSLIGVASAQSPRSECLAAYQNCDKVAAAAQSGCRYLTLYRYPPEMRKDAAKVLSWALNTLSRSRVISSPVFLTDTLARFSVVNYAKQTKEYSEWIAAWEKVGALDSTFGIITEVIDPNTHKVVVTRVDGGWLPSEYQQLKAKTISNCPILPADMFIYWALTSPFYDGFKGIPPTDADFYKSIGLDKAAIERLRANSGANLKFSGVALNGVRRIVMESGPLGGVYTTLDVEKLDAAHDPFRRPIDADGTRYIFEVTEGFAVGKNGLFTTWLSNAQGKRQNTVPERVAKDKTRVGIIANHRSCIVCHSEGLRPFVDDQSKLMALGPVESYNPEYVARLEEFYDDPRIQRQIKFDRETNEAAVSKATGGWTTKQLSEGLGKCISYFEDVPVTVETAAREVGQTVDDFKRANIHSNDPHIIGLIHGEDTKRGLWESSFAAAALTAEAGRVKK